VSSNSLGDLHSVTIVDCPTVLALEDKGGSAGDQSHGPGAVEPLRAVSQASFPGGW
jgi:hypothetical protein